MSLWTVYDNIKNATNLAGSINFSFLEDTRTLTIAVTDKIVLTANENTPSEWKVILESLNVKLSIDPPEPSKKGK